MSIFESIKVSVSAIFANKMRSLLTMLGIIIGISSVITVVALGEGSQRLIDKEFEQFGAGRAYFSMNWREDYTMKDLFTHDDVEVLKETFAKELDAIIPSVNERGQINTKSKKLSIDLTGADQDYIKIEKVNMVEGRYLMDTDVKGKRSVAVVDKEMALDVFGRTNVLGESVDVELRGSSVSLVIIGIYEKPSSALQGMGGKSHGSIFMPYTTLEKVGGFGDWIWDMQMSIKKGVNIDDFKDKIIRLIERRHDNEGSNKYMMQTAEEELKSINNITGIITMVVGAIAAISLLVGGIGVMNIMFVSVTERTREIGIRKAIGAKRRDILLQFLVESVIVSGIGGIIGTVIGLGMAFIVSNFIKVPPSISPSTIMIAWTFSAGVGIFFGIYPANKASKLDPIDALRYE